MVQEKDAAKKRVEARAAADKKRREEYEKSIIQTIYVVMETRPGYNTGGYYDQDIPADHRQVSNGFKTKAAAEKWMEEHEPDDGKYLWVGKKHLRQVSFTEWTGVFRA